MNRNFQCAADGISHRETGFPNKPKRDGYFVSERVAYDTPFNKAVRPNLHPEASARNTEES